MKEQTINKRKKETRIGVITEIVNIFTVYVN